MMRASGYRVDMRHPQQRGPIGHTCPTAIRQDDAPTPDRWLQQSRHGTVVAQSRREGLQAMKCLNAQSEDLGTLRKTHDEWGRETAPTPSHQRGHAKHWNEHAAQIGHTLDRIGCIRNARQPGPSKHLRDPGLRQGQQPTIRLEDKHLRRLWGLHLGPGRFGRRTDWPGAAQPIQATQRRKGVGRFKKRCRLRNVHVPSTAFIRGMMSCSLTGLST